jgi:energy-converting hydrogenase Eha subunit C
MRLGRGLLLGGGIAALASATPALLIWLLPGLGEGFFGVLAIMLTLSVTPLAVLIASVGAILLLVAVLRRDRSV